MAGEGLREAVARALRVSYDGAELLLSPARFWGCVADSEASDTIEGKALRGHVDEALLRPYHEAARADGQDALDKLKIAAQRASDRLRDEWAVDGRVANDAAQAIAAGVADYLNVSWVSTQRQPRLKVDPPMPPNPPIDRKPPIANPKRGGISALPIIAGVVVAILVAAVVWFVSINSGDGTQSARISFAGGDGSSGTMKAIEVDDGGSAEVPECLYSLDGHVFDCWVDETGNVYHPGQRIAVNDDTVLKAKWKAQECTVKFLGAGADGGSMKPITVASGSELTLPACDFTRNGYEFEGWADEDGVSHAPGESIAVEGDIAVTAQWKAEEKAESASTPAQASPASAAPKTTPSTKSPAASFPRMWSGTYIGTSSYVQTADHHISRAVAFNFTTVEESGYLEGICYVGTDDVGPGETYGTCYIVGNVDWATGAISMEGTSWIDQGGLGELRVYGGSVSFSSQSMGGTAWDKGTGAYETPWNVVATNAISIMQNGVLTTVY